MKDKMSCMESSTSVKEHKLKLTAAIVLVLCSLLAIALRSCRIICGEEHFVKTSRNDLVIPVEVAPVLKHEKSGPSDKSSLIELTNAATNKSIHAKTDRSIHFKNRNGEPMSAPEMVNLTIESPNGSDQVNISEKNHSSIYPKLFSSEDKAKTLANTTYCDCVKRSSLVSKVCSNTKFTKIFSILVTGVGRSGTDFVHAELQGLGLRMSHDNSRSMPSGIVDGSVAWPEAFNNKQFMTYSKRSHRPIMRYCKHESWNFHEERYGYECVFHLVRHPLKTIKSRWNLGNIKAFSRSNNCNTATYYNMSLPKRYRALAITLQHWTLWNSFIEQHASFRFRLEDLDSHLKHHILQKILEISQIQTKINMSDFAIKFLDERINSVSIDVHRNSGHTRKTEEKLRWEILAQYNRKHTAIAQIQAMRYGYEIPEDELLPEVFDECDSTVYKVQKCFFEYYEGHWNCNLYSERCKKS